VKEDASFVMEATGSYYIDLALFLHEQQRLVVVVNPLRIKKHIQADMSRNKSDKADAYAIARFGMEKELQPWRPLPRMWLQCSN
jgi:transposase